MHVHKLHVEMDAEQAAQDTKVDKQRPKGQYLCAQLAREDSALHRCQVLLLGVVTR